ncbi:hypothetical protein DFH09DRAFT_157523 [Mycena vulgaris]|nr:hypothetical protein DFH09DRAFT_157523 [Mycena vulgaris]
MCSIRQRPSAQGQRSYGAVLSLGSSASNERASSWRIFPATFPLSPRASRPNAQCPTPVPLPSCTRCVSASPRPPLPPRRCDDRCENGMPLSLRRRERPDRRGGEAISCRATAERTIFLRRRREARAGRDTDTVCAHLNVALAAAVTLLPCAFVLTLALPHSYHRPTPPVPLDFGLALPISGTSRAWRAPARRRVRSYILQRHGFPLRRESLATAVATR